MGLETAAIIALAGAAASGTAGIVSANKQAGAATDASNAQIAAANQAAQLQKQAADNTLAFEKDQAATGRADNITSQNANYQQWLYRQGIIRPTQGTGLAAENSLAQMLGLPAINTSLPATPPPPQFSGQAGSGSAPTANASSIQAINDALNKNYASLGVKATGPGSGPTDIAYMADKIAQTGGLTDANNSYWFGPNGRIAQELQKSGSNSMPFMPPSQ